MAVCGGVCWDVFGSPDLCDFSGACDPKYQGLPYCVCPSILMAVAV